MPNFYTKNFPAARSSFSWYTQREGFRRTDEKAKQKMRAMEKYAGLVSNTQNQHAREREASTIFQNESKLLENQQTAGNFLGQVYNLAVAYIAEKNLPLEPHAKLEDLFMFVAGFDDPREKLRNEGFIGCFNDLLKLTIEHCQALGTVKISAMAEKYNEELSKEKKPAPETPDLTQTKQVTMTPAADAAKKSAPSKTTADEEDEDEELIAEMDSLLLRTDSPKPSNN